MNPPIVFRHVGYNNTVAALNFLHGRFPTINKLLVTGFSAGGVASSAVVLPGAPHAGPDAGLSAERLGPDLPGAERDLQLAAAARR